MGEVMSVITLTDSTIEHIKHCLKDKPETAGFRFSVKQSGCTGFAYVPEIVNQPNENDIASNHSGVNVYVDPDSVEIIKGTVLDYVTSGLGQKQMVFKNPNVTDSCGCGESFAVKGDDS